MRERFKRFRVVVFGRPRGPWRSELRQAQQDAIDLDLGSYDGWGTFFITVPADIEVEQHQPLRLRA